MGPYGWHDGSYTPSLNKKPVRFRMPFHSAIREKFDWKLSEAEVIHLCIVNSRHLEPAEVPRVSAVVRTFFENQFCTRLPESEFLTLRSLPGADILQGLLPLISSLFITNAREAFEWTLDLAQIVAGKFPAVASQLLEQVPLDVRDAHPEWEMARHAQGHASRTTPATGLHVSLVKDVLANLAELAELAAANSLQIPRVSVGLLIDESGEIKRVDASESSMEYRELLLDFIEQSEQTSPEKCLQDLEAAVSLLQRLECKPLGLIRNIRNILESGGAAMLRLIGNGRIRCLLDPHTARDLCGVRARWQLPADLDDREIDWVSALATTLLWSSEPAGLSLLHVLLCREGLHPGLRSKIINEALWIWKESASGAAADAGWAGLLLVLEHLGPLNNAAKELRTVLLRRWRDGREMPGDGREMPVAIAMGLLSSQLAAGEADQETLPTLETLFKRSRQEPEADRIAMWVMRRLHDLDGKEARQIESSLRSQGALPLMDDTRMVVEGLLNGLGVRDPRYDNLTNHYDYSKMHRLVTLWASCASNPEDGSKAIHHLDKSINKFELQKDSDAAVIRAATFARVGFALPGENPSSRLLADEWACREAWNNLNSSIRANIAHAFLNKFAQERLPSNLENEWQIASKLESIASTALVATYPQRQLVDYFVATLDKVCRDGRYGFNSDINLRNAVGLCEKWKTQCPIWYWMLFPVAKAAVLRAIKDVGAEEVDCHFVDPRSYLEQINELEKGS